MDCSFFSSGLSKERKFFEERRAECNLFLSNRLELEQVAADIL